MILKFPAKEHVILETNRSNLRSFEIKFVEQQTRKAGGVHEAIFESLGGCRGKEVLVDAGELIGGGCGFNVGQLTSRCRAWCLVCELAGDSATLRLCCRSCFGG